jgi:hypothetical protein
MAAIAASDVTYNIDPLKSSYLGKAGKRHRGTISVGDGSLTYPSGGIPLDAAKLGCPINLDSLKILETNAKGYVTEWDASTNKIRLFITPVITVNVEANVASNIAGAPLAELGGSAAPAAMVIEVEAIGY